MLTKNPCPPPRPPPNPHKGIEAGGDRALVSFAFPRSQAPAWERKFWPKLCLGSHYALRTIISIS